MKTLKLIDVSPGFCQELLEIKIARTEQQYLSSLSGHDLACLQSYERYHAIAELNQDPLARLLGKVEVDLMHRRAVVLNEKREKMLSEVKEQAQVEFSEIFA